MTADSRGSWFRVYSRPIRQHPKFKGLTHAELGAWLDLRAEVDLLDGVPLADESEALHVLRRRSRNPISLLRKLVAVQLVDVLDDGRHAIHDRADHDRPPYPSDNPESVRERQRRSRESRRVTNAVTNGHDQSREESREESRDRVEADALTSLPAENDSATFACRSLMDGGRWLSDREYTAAWDDMDRRYTAEWVQSEIQLAVTKLTATGKVRAWDLKRTVDLRCAERSRTEANEHDRRVAEAGQLESDRLRQKAESATAEEKHRASVTRRAIGLWLSRRPNEPVPTDFGELEAWLAQNSGAAA